MAEVTVELAITATGGISEEYPFNNIRPTSTDTDEHYTISTLVYRKQALIQTQALSDQYKYKKLVSAGVLVPKVNIGATEIDFVALDVSDSKPDLTTINWYDAESLLRKSLGYNVGTSMFNVPRFKPTGGEYLDAELSTLAKAIVNAGTIFLYPYEDGQSFRLYLTYRSTNQMCLQVLVDTDVTITSKPYGYDKKSGYVDPRQAQTFSWTLDKDGEYSCAGDWTQASAVFHWRSGTSGAWNDISTTAQNVTIAANTFPVGTVQWYVSAVDNVGTASSSEVYTITTADAPMIATPVSPIGTVEDGSADVVFNWNEYNNNGSTPTGADLQISTDGTTWTDLASVTGTTTTYTATSLPGGQVWWRVRAYNADSVAGDWSSSVSFISVAAPPAPTVSVNAVPFAVITWQSDGQQAYRVTVDGVAYGPYFGTGKEFALKDYLKDGTHTASVEVQGIYGLWSQAGTVEFSIANVPGDAINLTGSFGRDGNLSWETQSATTDFLVYRDGVQIGATSFNGFTDRYVLGQHSYQVINRLPSGNYTASNIIQGTMRSCTTAIAPFSGGEWLELELSENSYSEQQFGWSRTSALRHYSGAVYPVIEMSDFEDATGGYDVSFKNVADARQFAALRGKIVIVKSRGGEVMIGALTRLDQRNTDFYIAFSFSIQRVDWEDFVNGQNN